MRPPTRLVDYPSVVVRLDCALCPRKGSYRLARLAARYGPEQSLEGLLADLAQDCSRRRSDPANDESGCGARFVEFEPTLSPANRPEAPVHRQRSPAREDVPKRKPAAPVTAGSVPMLSTWAAESLTIICDRCGRRQTWIKVDLLASGGDQRLTDLRVRLTADCPRQAAQSAYERCGARFEEPSSGG